MKRSATQTMNTLSALIIGILFTAMIPLAAIGQYVVDFEGAGETKTSYASGTVNLSGLDWDMTQALIGTADGDIKNGDRAARIRYDGTTYGSLTMLEAKPNGIGQISFYYARSNFSGDRTGVAPLFVVEYSLDGETWTQTGPETDLADVNSLTLFSSMVNVDGDIRVRIRQTGGDSGKRWNVDDITITNFTGVVPPSISNLLQDPASAITDETTVSVSADITAGDADIDQVELRWGTTSGEHPNTISMNPDKGVTYTTVTDIPAQAEGTTVYYVVYAEDADGETATSAERSYTVVTGFEPGDGGLETFDNFDYTGTAYINGEFEGENGITWYYTHVTGAQAYEIDGRGMILRRSGENSKIVSQAIPGGIGDFRVQLRKAFTGGGERQVELFINNVSKGTSVAFGEETGADDTIHLFEVTDINVEGDIVLEIRHITGGGANRQLTIDNITWTTYGDPDVSPPVIGDITQTPGEIITSETTVSVTAGITQGSDPIDQVELHWGTESGEHPNVIAMGAGKAVAYTTVSDIPAQADGTTVYYVIHAADTEGRTATSAQQNYTVRDPLTTALPYYNNFDNDLGEVTIYTISGTNRRWVHRVADENGFAEMNGFNTGDLEEDWLILPGINLDAYDDVVIMQFDTRYRFGEDDQDNFLKLMYSSDYAGLGSPEEATWTELPFERPTELGAWTPSGEIDLSDISGERVYIGFWYRYEPGQYREWRIDNIAIEAQTETILTALPDHISNFTYEEGEGPSDTYVFTLSGAHLDDTDVLIQAPASYEIVLAAGKGYSDLITLEAYDGSDTGIGVRLKAGLDAGDYLEEITISGGGANPIKVDLSGSVTEPPPPVIGLPYTQDFADFVFPHDTLLTHFGEGHEWQFISTGTLGNYLGDWGTGFSAGFRGNDRVLGYQHTSGTGIFTAGLTIENTTDEVLQAVEITYTGRVERAGEGRSPAWTVAVDGTEAPDLAYSTESGEDQEVSAIVSGLNIPAGESFTITWSSDRGGPAGSSKQIGIASLTIEAAEAPDIDPATISPDEFVFEDWPHDGSVQTAHAVITWNDASQVERVYAAINDQEIDLEYDVTDIDGATASFTLYLGGDDKQLKNGNEAFTIEAFVAFDVGPQAPIGIIFTHPTFFATIIVREDDTDKPLPNATIYVQETQTTHTTDEEGRYMLYLPAGTYTLDVTLDGYVPVRNFPIELEADLLAEPEYIIHMMPHDYVLPDPLALPYYNPFRSQDDYDAADEAGFMIQDVGVETGAGGYMRIFPGGMMMFPPIELEGLQGIHLWFDSQTFGGAQGQTLAVRVSEDAFYFTTIATYEITGSYETYQTEIDPADYENEWVMLRVEMVDGGASTRLREMHIFDPGAEYHVSFVVTDEDDPLEGAIINLNGQSETTGTDGRALFSLPNGSYDYTVTAEGYEEASGQVVVFNEDVEESVSMEAATYIITATAGDNGGIDPSGEVTVTHGDDQAFTITPDQGYRIAFVKVDGTDIDLQTDPAWNNEDRVYTFSQVLENHSIEAGFEMEEVDPATITPDEFVFEDFPYDGSILTAQAVITWNDASQVERVYAAINDQEIDLEYDVTDIDGATASFTLYLGGDDKQLKNGNEAFTIEAFVAFDVGPQAPIGIIFTHPTFFATIIVREDDTDKPLPNATIYVQETQTTHTTDEEGRYMLYLPAGTYTLDVSLEGYLPVRDFPIELERDMFANPEYIIHLAPDDYVLPDPLALPYYNPFRSQEDYDAAVDDGFLIQDVGVETGAGGYMRIFAGGMMQFPPIELEGRQGIHLWFDSQTYGGAQGQTLAVKVSEDAFHFTTIATYEITGSYETYQTEIDPADYENEWVMLRVEMVDGTASTRLREMHIFDPGAEYSVSFIITSGDDPIEGATIALNGQSETTGTDGRAVFSLANGSYDYTVTAEGYEEESGQIVVFNEDAEESVSMEAATYIITATAGDNGGIDPSGEVTVTHGDDQAFTITPDQGYRIAFVKVDGTDIDLQTDPAWNNQDRVYTFSEVEENHSIEAGFEVDDTGIPHTGVPGLQLYPNPATDYLHVHAAEEIRELRLLDLSGRQVYHAQPASNQVRISLSGLPTGVYLLQLNSASGSATKKIMLGRE